MVAGHLGHPNNAALMLPTLPATTGRISPGAARGGTPDKRYARQCPPGKRHGPVIAPLVSRTPAIVLLGEVTSPTRHRPSRGPGTRGRSARPVRVVRRRRPATDVMAWFSPRGSADPRNPVPVVATVVVVSVHCPEPPSASLKGTIAGGRARPPASHRAIEADWRPSSTKRAFACLRSGVSKPSVNLS